MQVQLLDFQKENDSSLDDRTDSISKVNITSADSAAVSIFSEQNREVTEMEGHSNLQKKKTEESVSLRTGHFLLSGTLRASGHHRILTHE